MNIKIYDYKDLNMAVFTKAEQPMEEKDILNEKSKFLHGSVFNIIQPSFRLSNSEYSYFEMNAWANSALVSLRNHLQDSNSRLKSLNDSGSFENYILKQLAGIDFLNELKKCSPEWRITWEKTRDEILTVYTDIIDMVDDCIDDDLIFYLKGY